MARQRRSLHTRRRTNGHHDAGDTLLEILVTLVFISLTLVALMGAFTTTINASADYRNASSLNTALVDATQIAVAKLQQQATPLFTPCATAALYNTKLQLTLPGYTLTVTAVDDFVNGTFVDVNSITCNANSPVATAPQEIFLLATRTGTISSAPISFVIDDRGGATVAALPTSVITVYSTPPSSAYVSGTYNLSSPQVPSATSGDVVQISSENTSVCTVSMTTYLVTFVAPGSCVLDFTDSGSANYNAATTIRQPFTVIAQNANTIGFNNPYPGIGSLNASYDPQAYSSWQPVVIGVSSTPAVCYVDGAGVIYYTGVGTCTITFSDAGNTAYAPATPVTWNITVNKAVQNALVLTSTSGIYGSTVNLTSTGGSGTGTVSYSVVNGTATSCSIDSTGRVLSSTSAGTCSVTVSKAGDNTYLPQSVTSAVTFIKATLTVTATAGTMTYGGTPPVVSVASIIGFVNGESSSVLTTQPTCSTTVSSSTQAGTAVSADRCSNAAAANYTFNYVPANVTVNRAALTITASSPTVPYGSIPTVTAGYSGFVNGEGPGSLTAAPTCGSPSYTTRSTPGTPNLTTSCSGAVDNNYTISYVTGLLAVTKATLTITANALSVSYGATFTPTSTITGFVNSDQATLTGATYIYQGTGTTSYGPSTTKPSAVGTYSITPSAATLNFTTGLASYYTYAYAAGVLTITTVPHPTELTSVTETLNQSTISSGTYTSTPLAPVLIFVSLEDAGALTCPAANMFSGSALQSISLVRANAQWDAYPSIRPSNYYAMCAYSALGNGSGSTTLNLGGRTNYGLLQVVEIDGGDSLVGIRPSTSTAQVGPGANPSFKLTNPSSTNFELLFGETTNTTTAPPSWTTAPSGFSLVSGSSQIVPGGNNSNNFRGSIYFGPAVIAATGSLSSTAAWGTISVEITP